MKETKESKCLSCEFKKEKDTQYGKMFQFLVKFENGDSGFISTKKNEDPFPVGAVSKYEIETKEIPSKVEGGEPYKFNAISKPKDANGFQRRDDSKERIKAHANVLVKELLQEKVLVWTDKDKEQGVKFDKKISNVSNFLANMMLKSLEEKGKENAFIIMSTMDVALVMYKLKDEEKFKSVYNELIAQI